MQLILFAITLVKHQEYDLDISFLNHKRYSRIKDISDECGIVKLV
jgi:hypothetical protein